ncbi:MAG: hypothetical protein ACI8Y4_001139 [Candidatus Poriferisodalaceae bacterium]|jgi:hypothetical protein
MLESDGTFHPFGDASNHRNASVQAAVQLSSNSDGSGCWVLDRSGIITVFGSAQHFGDLSSSPAELAAGEHPSTMSVMPNDTGYWIFTTRGRAINFRAAQHHGDVSHLQLAGPVIASVATPSGNGYHQVGSDGGIFTNGDAVFYGSVPEVLPGVTLNEPVVGISSTPTNDGYWLVAGDGGVFSFGEAPYRGSVPAVLPTGVNLAAAVNGMVAYGNGYLLVAGDVGVFEFSDLSFLGSLGATPLDSLVVAITALRAG